MTRKNKGRLSIDLLLTFSFGILALLLLFCVALFVETPNSLLLLVFRVTLALACAGVAAMLPGFVQLSVSTGTNMAIRAGGAVAIFVLIYLVDPGSRFTSIANDCIVPSAPNNEFLPIAESWTRKVDEGRYEDAYDSASNWTKNQYTLDLFTLVFREFSQKMGALKNRKIYGVTSVEKLPSAECGNFRVVTFLSKFEGEAELLEFVVLMIENNRWVVREHTFSAKN